MKRALLSFIVSLFLFDTAYALDKLNGTFMVASHVPTARISPFMDELKSLSMDTIILSRFYTKTKPASGDACTSDLWTPEAGFTFNATTSKLTVILNEAARRNIKVYIGLVFSSGVCSNWYLSPNVDYSINKTRTLVYNLEKMYKNHPAFAGFYLTDEPGLSAYSVPQALYTAFSNHVKAVRAYSSRPIVVSPYLGYGSGVGIGSPTDIAKKAAALQATGVNIQAWQDSVGADGSFSAEQTKPYYAAIASRIGKQNLWADIELFNGYIPFEPNPYSGTRNKPTISARLIQQMNSATNLEVSKRVTWINSYFMSAMDFGYQTIKSERIRSSNAHRLFDAYKARVGLGGGIVKPISYSFSKAPSSSYPDSGYELFDGKVGKPKNFLDPAWTGFLGNVDIVMNLGRNIDIKWVGAHVLNSIPEGIRIPTAMSVSCYYSGVWKSLGRTSLLDTTTNTWVERKDGEFVFTNETPFQARCSQLKVTLENGSWTFLSEIEIVTPQKLYPPPENFFYSWRTAPASAYSDSGGELSNNLIGSSLYSDPQWVGILGRAEFLVNLSRPSTVTTLNLSLLNDPGPSIYLPNKISVNCSLDNKTYTEVYSHAFTRSNYKQAMRLSLPIGGKSCQYLVIKLENSTWTFISELNVN